MPTLIKRVLHKLYITFMGVMINFAPGSSHVLFAGENSSRQLCRHIARRGLGKVLLVTDKPLVELGIAERASSGLVEAGVETVMFDAVIPDPSYQVVADGLVKLKSNACDGILAVGGGSSIDAAKIIAMAATNSGDLRDYVGFGKIDTAPLPLYAIPTTSGTGSEATMGAVISDSDTHQKSIISDAALLPLASCLDPELLTALPPHISAATGMDALTHAIEAYIGVWDRGDSLEKAGTAVKMIFENLPTVCSDGADLASRDAMAHAAYMAGQAINQVNVGSVHAIAHALGGKYGIPHGLANACVLPHVLELSRQAADSRLTELAELLGLSGADAFISAVRDLGAQIGIPATVKELRTGDIPALVDAACAEAFGYPVPYLMSTAECEGILRKLVN